MAINPDHWKTSFTEFPTWICPTCQSGNLAIDQNTLKVVETGPSERAHGHEAWEPEWIEQRFVGLLICQNINCREIVSAGGSTELVEGHDYERQEHNWVTYYKPRFLVPPPSMFIIPEECPEDVCDHLRRAFGLYWSDAASSANALRVAVEAMLDNRRINKTKINRRGKRKQLPLHDRIVDFASKDPESAKLLLAIKWLGNVGSHRNSGDPNRSDIVDAFEMFEHVIERVYVRKVGRLAVAAKRITARKGRPVPKRKRRSR